MLAIPLDRPGEPVVEGDGGLPAELAESFVDESVAQIVAGPILDERDQRLVGAHQLAHLLRQLEVREFESAPDVEDVAGLAVVANTGIAFSGF